MNNVVKKMALYQKWPSRVKVRFGLVDTSEPTMTISVLPATKEGLEIAIDLATRSDAKLIGMNEDFFDDDKLQSYVEGKINDKKFTLLFKPLNTVRSI